MWLLLLLGLVNAQTLMAQVAAQPLRKDGACPSGYTASGHYCVPGKGARYASKKTGACPSGYSASGRYCLAGKGANFAFPKISACPTGSSSSGEYCLASR